MKCFNIGLNGAILCLGLHLVCSNNRSNICYYINWSWQGQLASTKPISQIQMLLNNSADIRSSHKKTFIQVRHLIWGPWLPQGLPYYLIFPVIVTTHGALKCRWWWTWVCFSPTDQQTTQRRSTSAMSPAHDVLMWAQIPLLWINPNAASWTAKSGITLLKNASPRVRNHL